MTPHQKKLVARYPHLAGHFAHEPDDQSITIWQKLRSYTGDTIQHIRNGLKVTPPAVEKIRLETCQVCPNYNSQKQSCKLCGCKSNGSTWLTNKLKRASSVCPDKPPRWLACQPPEADGEQSSPPATDNP